MDDLKTLLKLAESGDKKSQFELAKRYEQTETNREEEYLANQGEALKWYKILAEGNVSDKLDESFYAKCKLIEFVFCDEFTFNGRYINNPYYMENKEYLKWGLDAIVDLDRIRQKYPIFYFEQKKKDILDIISWICFISYEYDFKDRNCYFKYFKQSALLGVKEAAEKLGFLYLQEDDEDEALKWFTQGERYYHIGWIYKYIKHKQDYSRALEYFQLAIKDYSNYGINACLELGELYYNGWGTSKDFKKAAEWYHSFFTQSFFINTVTEYLYILKCGANNGNRDWNTDIDSLLKDKNPEEILEMGDSYLHNGEIKEGLDFFLSICRDVDDPTLKAKIAYCIANIYNLELNDKIKAIYYYKKSVQLGNTNALNKLEDIYLFIRNHEEKALEWFEQKDTSEFYYILGLLYKKGEGFKQDYSKALSAFELAANTKYKYTKDYSLGAMFELGEFYYNGYGVPVNYEKAAKWYQTLKNKFYPLADWPNRSPLDDWFIGNYEHSSWIRYRTLQIQDSDLELPFQSAENDSVPF